VDDLVPNRGIVWRTAHFILLGISRISSCIQLQMCSTIVHRLSCQIRNNLNLDSVPCSNIISNITKQYHNRAAIRIGALLIRHSNENYGIWNNYFWGFWHFCRFVAKNSNFSVIWLCHWIMISWLSIQHICLFSKCRNIQKVRYFDPWPWRQYVFSKSRVQISQRRGVISRRSWVLLITICSVKNSSLHSGLCNCFLCEHCPPLFDLTRMRCYLTEIGSWNYDLE